MLKLLRKAFGGISLTWPKVIVGAVAAGVWTAVMALVPALQDTSFHAIAVTLEAWILFGLLIIMNSKSPLDAALKCFVFFLISQPLVYLIQVPFSRLGWQLFVYYKYWFIWTLLCFPMGFVGYYMKKGRWWGYLILLPMILLTAYSYVTYLGDFLFSRPRYALVVLFCAAAMILYPVAIFDSASIRRAGAAAGAVILVAATAFCLSRPPVYSTELMTSGEEHPFDDKYTVSLADSGYGDVDIRYIDAIESYAIHADLKRAGHTVMTLRSPDGETTEYDLTVERDRYEVTGRPAG